jgi:hypothetical protein
MFHLLHGLYFFGFEPAIYVGPVEFDIFGTDADIWGAVAAGYIFIYSPLGIAQVNSQILD